MNKWSAALNNTEDILLSGTVVWSSCSPLALGQAKPQRCDTDLVWSQPVSSLGVCSCEVWHACSMYNTTFLWLSGIRHLWVSHSTSTIGSEEYLLQSLSFTLTFKWLWFTPFSYYRNTSYSNCACAKHELWKVVHLQGLVWIHSSQHTPARHCVYFLCPHVSATEMFPIRNICNILNGKCPLSGFTDREPSVHGIQAVCPLLI